MGGLTNFRWFEMPTQLDKMVAYAEANADLDVYYSPFLYTKPPALSNTRHAAKDNVTKAACVWADGDDCPTDKLRIQLQSLFRPARSTGRDTGYSKTQATCPTTCSKPFLGTVRSTQERRHGPRLALSKKLRVPFTHNLKKAKPWEITLG